MFDEIAPDDSVTSENLRKRITELETVVEDLKSVIRGDMTMSEDSTSVERLRAQVLMLNEELARVRQRNFELDPSNRSVVTERKQAAAMRAAAEAAQARVNSPEYVASRAKEKSRRLVHQAQMRAGAVKILTEAWKANPEKPIAEVLRKVSGEISIDTDTLLTWYEQATEIENGKSPDR